jgi:hypothetical protein
LLAEENSVSDDEKPLAAADDAKALYGGVDAKALDSGVDSGDNAKALGSGDNAKALDSGDEDLDEPQAAGCSECISSFRAWVLDKQDLTSSTVSPLCPRVSSRLHSQS